MNGKFTARSRRSSPLKPLLPFVRVCAMLLQVGVTIALLGVALIPAAFLIQRISGRFGLLVAAFTIPAAYATWGLCFCALVIVAKRIVFPSTPIGSFSFYSTVVVRWAFVTQLAKVAHQMFLTWVIGTDLIAWWFALLGARIGKRVTINTIFIYDWDLLDIGDDCFIGGRSTVMGHIGQGGRVVFSPTRLGSQCTVGQDSCVFCGVVMEDRAMLGANSLVLRNQRLLANTKYLGVPAEMVGSGRGRPVPPPPNDERRTYESDSYAPVFLDRNENNFPAAEACLRVLSNLSVESLTRYSRTELLGDRLSEWLQVERNRIAVGAGAECVLKNAFHSLVSAGDAVLLPMPSWSYYDDLASEASASVSYYPVESRGETFSVSSDRIVELARSSGARLVLLASPNNPTGNSMEIEDLRSVLTELSDTRVVLDEAYWGYRSQSNAHVAGLIAEFPNLLIVRSFSKFFGMPGLRVGFGVAGSGMDAFMRRSWAYLGHNRISEHIAVAALDNIQHFVTIADQVEAEKDLIVKSLREVEGVFCHRSDANFLLVRLRPHLTRMLKSRAESRGIHLKYFSEGPLANCVRITIGTPAQNTRVIQEFQGLSEVAA